jgi:hypothetical protein
MDRMEQLKAEARGTAKLRGHQLGKFMDSVITSGSHQERPAQVAVCRVCAAIVVVDPAPPPGEPSILGQAVDMDCHAIERETHESA